MTDNTDKSLVYPDQPISSPDEDRFGRWPFARQMGKTICGWNDQASLVMGLYGEWGEGKTSVLNLLAHAIKDQTNIHLLRFNPWRFNDENKLLREFFQAVARALNHRILEKGLQSRVADLLTRYGNAISWVPEPKTTLFGKALSGVGSFLGGKDSGGDVEFLRSQIDEILRKQKQRIVVIIDDLDRLEHEEIRAVFRLVKSTADFPYTTYILAFDPDHVSEALNSKFPGGPQSGQAFLEKIIQVALHLPPASPSGLKALAFNRIQEALNATQINLSQEDADKFVLYFDRGFLARLRSPRAAKRYANAVAFGLPLLIGEINVVDYLLLEALRTFYPDAYKVIRSNPDVFLAHSDSGGMTRKEDTDRRRAIVVGMMEGLAPNEAESLQETVKFLFPQVESVLGGSNYGSSWQDGWTRELRICSKAYFNRFFHYGVPPGDVSNQAIEALLQLARTSSDQDKIQSEIQIVAGAAGWKTLIEKLREREKHFDPAVATVLSRALGRLSKNYPKERGMFSFAFSTFGQAAILVRNMVQAVPAAERPALAKNIIGPDVPLLFSAECFRWFRPHKEDSEKEQIFQQSTADELGRMLAERIGAEDQRSPLYETYSDNSAMLYYIWKTWGSAEAVAKGLTSQFSQDPKNAQKFIRIFVPTAWSMESGVPRKSEIQREQYDAIQALVDPQIIVGCLQKIYSASDLESQEFPYGTDHDDPDKTWARQFAWLHKKVNAQQPVTS